MLHLTRRGAQVGCVSSLDRARETFAKNHLLRLPQLLSAELRASITNALGSARFATDLPNEEGFTCEDRLEDGPLLALLQFVMNDPRLFAFVEAVTGCGPIGCFAGRVYRRRPVEEHHSTWHADLHPGRLVAISVNLGSEAFRGGHLQIREQASRKQVAEVANTGPGDGVLFRIDPALSHRVTDVEGEAAKIALAGWFRSFPDAQTHLRELFAGARSEGSGGQGGAVGGTPEPACSLESRVRVPPQVVSHAIDGGTVLYHWTAGISCELDAIGARIWELLAASGCVRHAYDACLAEYDAEPDELRRELLRCVGSWQARGMLEALR